MALTRPKYSSILDTDFKVSCKVATTGSSITLAGGAPNAVDGQNLSVGDRILVRDQSTASENGVYVVSTVGTGSNGTWTRAKDFASSTNVTSGIMIPVTQGNTRGGRIYLLTTPDPITLNSTNLTFTDVTFSPGYGASITNSTAATNTTSGALTVTGGVGIGGNIYVGGNANVTGDANITGNIVGGNISTAGTLNVTGNANTGNLGTATAIITTGNITTINSGLMQNGNSNIAITANGNITFTSTSNATMVVTGTGANITGTANITSDGAIGGNLTIAGNLIVNGSTTTVNTATLDVTDLNITVAKGAINAAAANGAGLTVDGAGVTWIYNSTSNTWVSNVGANIGGTINATGNANVGNLGTTDLVVTGVSNLNSISNVKITGGSSNQFIQTDGLGNLSFVTLSPSSIFNGNSNVSVAANSNVTVSVAGNANVVTITGTGANIAGTANITGNVNVGNIGGTTAVFTDLTGNLTTAAQPNITSVGTLSSLGVSGTVTASTFTSNVATGTAPLVVTSTTQVANLNVAAAGSALTAGTVTTAAQPNITSVGTLSTLNVTGNANTGNLGTGTVIATTANLTTVNSGLMQNGNSNVTIAANSNVSIFVDGNATARAVFTSSGANIAGAANITGDVIAGVNLISNYSSGDEGGEIKLAIPQTNTTLSTSVTIDINQNRLRIFESGGTNRGAYIDLTATTAGVGSNLLAGGGGGGITFTANATAPTSPSLGDQWYDTAADILFTRINDGSGNLWLDLTSAPRVPISTASSSAPTSPTPVSGDFWWDTTDEVLYVRAGPAGADFWLDISSQPNTFAAITASNATVTSNLTVGNINLSGAITDSAQLDIQTSAGNSNIVLSPHGTGSIVVTKNLLPNANATLSLGNSSLRFANIWGLASSAQYADLAERYLSDKPYDPGTVVVFGGSAEITVTVRDHDHRIAGVVSTDPAYLMNDSADKGNLWLPIALQGRVPTRVVGPVRKGDLLVSSSEPGVARRMSKALYEPGCVIGKSLEDHDSETVKVIEVVVGRI